MKDLVEILEAMIATRDRVERPLDLLYDASDRVVRAVAPLFNAQNDEVAILLLTADGKHLRFAAPRKLADLGSIPVTKRDSIAVNILGRRKGEATNNVRMVKHVAFFESVKLRDRAMPIQKMVTVPIMNGAECVGVAQISRKGENPSDAGPDFTEADVKRASDFFAAVARYLAEARPPRF